MATRQTRSARSRLLVAGAVAGFVGAWLARQSIAGIVPDLGDRSTAAATAYDLAFRPLGFVYERIADQVAAELPHGGQVLDVGCGPGRLALALARRSGLSVTGADVDEGMVTRARANADRTSLVGTARPVRFVVADVAALPFPDASFDLVVSTFSFHHWTDPDVGLIEVHRVLRPRGRAVIWDVVGPIRRLETRAPLPHDVARNGPFAAMRRTRSWSIGPIAMVERYDLSRAAAGADELAG